MIGDGICPACHVTGNGKKIRCDGYDDDGILNPETLAMEMFQLGSYRN